MYDKDNLDEPLLDRKKYPDTHLSPQDTPILSKKVRDINDKKHLVVVSVIHH
jgi:hypothetical protein